MSRFTDAAERVASGADPRQEANGLVAELTLEEKLGCLDGDIPFWPGLVSLLGGAYHERTWPAAVVVRLGIPGLHFADGPRGCVIGPSTCFPVSMARGASFDPELERRVGEAIGAELRAAGATFTGAVCMNLLRHPAWGRAQETYGEDPHHVGEMAAALTEGLQRHVMACMKHYALNSMENARFKVDVTADERALHEVYLPHFKRVAAAGVASVMSAYNSVNGEWCGENRTLLRDILREEWGWDGFVITDFIMGLRDAVKSVNAGCNVEMPFRHHRAQALAGAVASGELAEAEVDARVEETFATFLRFARVFEERPDRSVIASPAHRALAREAASASMVLLRNEGELLPVAPSAVGRVAVLGRLAAVPNLGDAGSSNVLQPDVTTPLAGLRAAFPDAEVVHSDDDVGIAAGADLAVVVVGYTLEDEGEFVGMAGNDALGPLMPPIDHPELGLPESMKADLAKAGARRGPGLGSADGGDRSSLRLHDADEQLIARAAAASDRVVVAVMGGSAVVMPWLERVPAALVLWYPGMEGGHAFADVLTGAVEPGGRLPFAIPLQESDLVPFDKDATAETYGLLHGQWHLDATGVTAQLPFGHGLGFTSFELEAAKRDGEGVQVDVRNTGEREGSSVVQVYASVPTSRYERPPRRLVGFQRVSAGPGAATSVRIPIDRAQLDVREGGSWLREDAPVVLHAGFDAAHLVEVA